MKGIDIFSSFAGNATHQHKTVDVYQKNDLNQESIGDEYDRREEAEPFQVDHPAEPEEDQPVKFPLPDFVFQTRASMKAEYAEKREERIDEGKERKELLKQVGSKKHHLLKRDRIKSESFSGTRRGIFGIFQDCRNYEV